MDVTRYLLDRAPIEPLHSVGYAKQVWAMWRADTGAWGEPPLLTHPSHNTKLNKSDTPSYGLCLSPAESSGIGNVCRYSTPECRAGCVAFAGKGELAKVQRGRTLKTRFLVEEPNAFVTLLAWEIHRAFVKHEGNLAVRLNAFSDIPWERVTPWLFEWAHDTQFYDYTKWSWLMRGSGIKALPSNYDLTYSVEETWDESRIRMYLDTGVRIAMVVPRGQEDTPRWHGFPCVNGDHSDSRWLDPKPALVLLKAKGRLRNSAVGGFVRNVNEGSK